MREAGGSTCVHSWFLLSYSLSLSLSLALFFLGMGYSLSCSISLWSQGGEAGLVFPPLLCPLSFLSFCSFWGGRQGTFLREAQAPFSDTSQQYTPPSILHPPLSLYPNLPPPLPVHLSHLLLHLSTCRASLSPPLSFSHTHPTLLHFHSSHYSSLTLPRSSDQRE